MELSKDELAQQCCILFYEKLMQQADIAKGFCISRPYVSKLIKYAIDTKLVEIKVELKSDLSRDVRLEMALLENFKNVEAAFVLKSTGKNFSKANFGRFAATNINGYIADSNVIGISYGNSIEAMIESLPGNLTYSGQRSLLPIMGGLSNANFTQPHVLISELGKKTGAEAYFLNCPVVVEKKELRDMLLTDHEIFSVSKKWDEIDVVIAGIEDSLNGAKLLQFLTKEDVANIKQCGSAGSIAALYFDDRGRHTPIMDDRRMGISFEQFRKIPTKVILGQGSEKVNALKAAMGSGLVDVVITDSPTAAATFDFQS